MVRGDDCVYLFDEHGALIDEAENFTPGGVQQLEGEDNFLDEWRNGYYKHITSVDSPEDKRVDPMEELFAEGKRIKMCFGAPVAWYTGTIYRVDGDATHVAFDDGEMKKFSFENLTSQLAASTVAAAVEEEGGVIANETGNAKMARVTYYSPGGRAAVKPVGVLIGASEDMTMGGVPICQASEPTAHHHRPAPLACAHI